MRTKAWFVPLLALVMAGTLTACDPGGLPIPTPPETSASATPSQPAEESDPPGQVEITRVLVGSETVALGDDSGFGVASFTYEATAGDAVNVLKLAFGPSPIITDHPGGVESGPYRSYDWGGFELHEVIGTPGLPPYTPLSVVVTAGSIGAVTIFGGAETVRVGAPMSAAVAVETGHGAWTDFYQAMLDTRHIDPASVGEPPGDLQIFVAVYGPPGGGGDVTHFVSPTPNWGV
jgi:hypothetical protein